MSAKNGLTRSFRLLGCLMAVALIASAVLASTASAKKTLTPTAYIAMGDSLSFGYKAATKTANTTANKANCEAALTAAGKGELALAKAENAICNPATTYEAGFVGYFGKRLAKTEKVAGNSLTTVNLGCPGENSDGLIGHTLGKTGGQHEPCGYHNFIPGGNGYPLKTEIGSASQLEAAISTITTKAAGTVTAVSLQIGSNDELFVVGLCSDPKYDGEHGFATLTACLQHEAGPEGYAYEGGLFKHILTNIGTTIGVLRSVAKYGGKVLVLGFYNPNATLLVGSNVFQDILNKNLEGAIAGKAYGEGVELAQPFETINPEARVPAKEGETAKEKAMKEHTEIKAICRYTEMCGEGKAPTLTGDIHPTAKGYSTIGKLMVKAF